MRTVATGLLALLLVYATLCLMVFLLQRSLQYFPDRSPMDPAAAGLPQGRAERLATSDGEQVVAWWVAPRDARAPVYLYLHGNGANLQARGERLARLTADGAGLLALSWRGYGGSTGRPTEAGLHADARAAYGALRARGVEPRRIVLFGESLGSTVAVMLAAEQPVRALVLDSAFASALDVARSAYPWLPVRWLLRDTYRADLAAPRVAVPVLQVHCSGDPVTPLASAQALHALLPQAEPLHRLEGRCHVAPLGDYDSLRRRFIERVFGTPG